MQNKTQTNNIKTLNKMPANKFYAVKNEKIRLPIDKLNPTDLYVPCQVNGKKYIIKRGEDTIVPKYCAELLRQAGYLD